MNLDRVFVRVALEQLKVVLGAVAYRLEGFSQEEVHQLCADVAALEADDDVLVELTISIQGDAVPLLVDVFKDSEGALEIVFIVAPVLTSMVQDVARAIVGAAAVRSMIAKQASDSEP